MKNHHVVLSPATGGRRWGQAPYAPASSPAEENSLYSAVEALFAGMGLDARRQGEAVWNPLGDLVPAGGRIVIKPNLVRHVHGSGGPLEAVVSDPRILRAVVDYAVRAVSPGGQVVIADSPLQSCDMAALRQAMGLDALIAATGKKDVTVRLLDFRREQVEKQPGGLIGRRTPLSGDPEGYTAVDLGNDSALRGLAGDAGRFRVTQYDARITARHHGDPVHEFLIPRSLLRADLVISLPKVKTHRKAGMTGALKNLVGINGSKAWLPHHRHGAVSEGGDEYLHPSWRKRMLRSLWEKMDRTASPALLRTLSRADRLVRQSGRVVPFPDPYFEGSWWGNMTMAAMVCDLNRVLLYAHEDGGVRDHPQRRMLVVADAVLAGEGEGPLEPTPREMGLILGGVNPVAVDWVATTLLGFDPWKIPCLTRPLETHRLPLVDFTPTELEVLTAGQEQTLRSLGQLAAGVRRPFQPPSGWRGHIEAAPPLKRMA